MRFRYTATRGINTPNPVNAFDLTGAYSFFRTTQNVIDRAEEFELSAKFCVSDSGINQRLIGANDLFDIWLNTNEFLVIRNRADAVSTTTALAVTYDVEHSIIVVWDGAGNMTLTYDGNTEASTPFVTYTAEAQQVSAGDWNGNYRTNGAVYDVILKRGGRVVNHWPLHDGQGTAGRDVVGGANMNLTDGGAVGWTEYNAPHVIGQQYLLNVPIRSFDRSVDTQSKTVTAIGGYKQTTWLRTEEEYSFKTAPLTGHEARDFREFLDSCQAGESFEVDTGATPTVWRRFYLSDNGYSESRDVRRGSGGFNDYFSFGFKADEG